MKERAENMLKKIQVKQVWDEMPVYCFTSDMDWASEDVMKEFYETVNEMDIKLTMFVTHKSELTDKEYEAGNIDRGIHPNFLEGSSQGSNFKEIAETCTKLAPEAYGFRSHRCFEVTDVTHMLKNEYNYKYVSNLATVLTPRVRPILHESGLINFPIFFEDGTHLYNELDLDFRRYEEYFTSPGLKVMCFHPMNFVFNSPTMPYMRKIKNSLSREEFNNISTATIEKMRNREMGVGDTMKDIIKFVKDNKFPIMSMNELYKMVGE